MNQYLKVVHVMGTYVKMDSARIPPISAFIEGYCREFPDEQETVLLLWEQASGHPYTGEIGSEIWIEVPDANHSPVAIIQFGMTTRTTVSI